jgi:hypothetical protein
MKFWYLPAVGIFSLIGSFATLADAGVTIAGSACQAYNGNEEQYLVRAPTECNNPDLTFGQFVSITIPVDHTIGSSADFSARVFDNSASQVLECFGYARSGTGASVHTVGFNTGPASAKLTTTISGTVSIAASTANFYDLDCWLPNTDSSIAPSAIIWAKVE